MALRVTGTLSLDGTPFHQTLTRADLAVRRFASGMTGRFAALFSIGAVGYAIRRTVEYADTLSEMTSRTGVAVEQLQRFDRWAKDSGATLQTLVGFWERLPVARSKALGGQAAERALMLSAEMRRGDKVAGVVRSCPDRGGSDEVGAGAEDNVHDHHSGGAEQEGLAAADDACRYIEATEERWWEPEVRRVRGEILARMAGRNDAGEEDFRRALTVARAQASVPFEARAGACLAKASLAARA